METTGATRLRRAALTGEVGAALTAASAVVVQFAVQPATTVSDKMWSYPWSGAALVPVSVLYAAFHVLVVIGLLGLWSSGATASPRAARRGVSIAIAGTGLLFVGELASILVRHARIDDASAMTVGLIFAVGIVLIAVGFLVTGVATLRTGAWAGWRRFTPLVVGISCLALLALNTTKALPTGVALYGVCLMALFFALATEPVPVAAIPIGEPQMA